MENLGSRLLDFSQPFEVQMLDVVVQAMNDPQHHERKVANEIMVALQSHQDAWNKVCDILEQSANPSTRFFGLQILEDAVKYRWKTLPTEQREGIKVYIVNKLLDVRRSRMIMMSDWTIFEYCIGIC